MLEQTALPIKWMSQALEARKRCITPGHTLLPTGPLLLGAAYAWPRMIGCTGSPKLQERLTTVRASRRWGISVTR
jgi:hypothetical protein